jgi:hypothetical protein
VKFIHVKFNRKLDTGQLKFLNKLMNDVVADKSQLGERERERERDPRFLNNLHPVCARDGFVKSCE